MHRRACYALIFALLFSVHSHAQTNCIDPALLGRSTVSITRYFDDEERSARTNLVGIQGTAWFQSPTTIVTVEHVATAMELSSQSWKLLNLEHDGDMLSISVRIQRSAGAHAEKLVVLELQTAIAAAPSVAIRMSPLMPEDRLVAVAYPGQNRRSVGGRFVKYATDGRLAGTALLEMYEGDNRLAIDHGASGAPVFDCEGRVVAVIATVMTQIFQTPFGERRVSTAWGMPNVVSVPIQELIAFPQSR
jgi:Trypsin-like peptidase domain